MMMTMEQQVEIEVGGIFPNDNRFRSAPSNNSIGIVEWTISPKYSTTVFHSRELNRCPVSVNNRTQHRVPIPDKYSLS